MTPKFPGVSPHFAGIVEILCKLYDISPIPPETVATFNRGKGYNQAKKIIEVYAERGVNNSVVDDFMDIAEMPDDEKFIFYQTLQDAGITGNDDQKITAQSEPLVISNRTAVPKYVKLLGKITPDAAAKDPRNVLPAVFSQLESDRKLGLTTSELTAIFAPLAAKISENDDQADALHRTLNAIFTQNKVDQKPAQNLSDQLLIYHLSHPFSDDDQKASFLNGLLLKETSSLKERLPEKLGEEIVNELKVHEEARLSDPETKYESVQKLILDIENSAAASDAFIKHYIFNNDLDHKKALQEVFKSKEELVNKLRQGKITSAEISQLFSLRQRGYDILKRKQEFTNLRLEEEKKHQVKPLENELVAQFTAHGLSASEARQAAREFIGSNLHLAHGYISSFLNKNDKNYAAAKASLFSDALEHLKDKFPNLASKLTGFKLNVEKFDKAFQSITYFKNIIDNPGAMLQIFSQKIIQDFSKRVLEKYALPTLTKVLGNEAVNLAIKQALKKFVASNVGKAALKFVGKEASKRILEALTAETIVGPVIVEAAFLVLGPIIDKFMDAVSWLQRKIKERAKEAAAVIAMLVSLFVPGLGFGGAAAMGVITYGVASAAGGLGRVLTRNPSAGMVQGANRINYVITALIVETAKDSFLTIFLVVLATPIVIAFILLIITSSAYVVPQEIKRTGSDIPQCWPIGKNSPGQAWISQRPCGDTSHKDGIDMNAFDLASYEGDEIHATHDGTVIVVIYAANDTYGYGNHVIIKNNAGDLYTLYAHMQTVAVSTGQSITLGDVVGTEGNTTCCGNSYGIHLHYEIRSDPTTSIPNNCDAGNYVPPGWKENAPLNYDGTCYAEDGPI